MLRFFRGQIDKYTWVDLGSSYLPSDILAAVLFAQLEARTEIQRKRRRIWETYQTELADWAGLTASASPSSQPGASNRITCSTCCYPRSRRASR